MFKPKKQQFTVEQIHAEFDSGEERILAECNKILSNLNIPTETQVEIDNKLTDKENRSGFLTLPNWFIDILSRIEEYIKSVGLNVYYSVRTPGEWINIDSLEDLTECRYLVSKNKNGI